MTSVGLRIAAAVFLLYLTYLARPGSSLFSWHPTLMALAFTGLMAEAVFMFSKDGLAHGRPHTTKVRAHYVVLAVAAVAHGLGYAAIYYTKEEKQKPHLTSWHGCLGFLTSILLWTQLSAGVFSLYPGLLQSVVPLKVLRAGHSLSGTVTFVCGVVTLCLGLCSVWFQSNAVAWSVYPAVGLHGLLLVIACKRHVNKYIWRDE